MRPALSFIDRYFSITAKGSSLHTEILAGLSTFLALSYIFVVNPAILAQAGMNPSAVLFATIVTSGLATILMGLWARLPFVLAPGMEMNAYVAYFVVGALGFKWQEALGAVFWSGVLFIVLTVTKVRQNIIAAIPDRMKSSLALSVGVFLALVAFKISGVLHYEGVQVTGLGNLRTPEALVLAVSLALVLLLHRSRVPGSIMLAIILSALLCHALGLKDTEEPAKVSSTMLSQVARLDTTVILNPRILSVILILFLIDFYGSVAKLIGLSSKTSIMDAGRLPRMKEALLIDSGGTLVGSALGTSSITVYVESAVGIGVGGRTGLCALVCGAAMLGCFALTPLLHYVPVGATTGALLFVAVSLCPSLTELKSFNVTDTAAMIAMQAIVIWTFALDRAMLAGFVVHACSAFYAKRRVDVYLLGSIVFLALGVWVQSRG